MVEKKKVTARPPAVWSIEDKEMAFINEGIIDVSVSNTSAPKKNDEEYPWEKDGVRDDVMKVFNVRLSESYFLKLKYVSEHIGKSSNNICVSLIKDFLDKEVSRLRKG